jgi:hypothetical protein
MIKQAEQMGLDRARVCHRDHSKSEEA